jgi:hypothetical protein
LWESAKIVVTSIPQAFVAKIVGECQDCGYFHSFANISARFEVAAHMPLSFKEMPRLFSKDNISKALNRQNLIANAQP